MFDPALVAGKGTRMILPSWSFPLHACNRLQRNTAAAAEFGKSALSHFTNKSFCFKSVSTICRTCTVLSRSEIVVWWRSHGDVLTIRHYTMLIESN